MDCRRRCVDIVQIADKSGTPGEICCCRISAARYRSRLNLRPFAMQLIRLGLYKLVCDRPLSKVAPALGISGTVLAAICKRYQVPYPGSGYWTRMSLGLPAELPALPEASDETIEITPSIPKPRHKRTLEEVLRTQDQARCETPSSGTSSAAVWCRRTFAKNTARKRRRVPQALQENPARSDFIRNCVASCTLDRQ